MHPDDKENNRKEYKTKLCDIKVNIMSNRNKEQIYYFHQRIKEKEEQTWQKLRFISVHCKEDGYECNNKLNESIEYHTRSQ